MSFGPDVRRTPDALTSVPLVLNIARSLSSVSRKARSKHALFNVARSSSDLDRSPWAVKFESSEQPLDAASVTHLVDVMDKIEVCKSTTKDHPDLLRSIAEGMTLVRVAPGDTVCRQGEPGLFFMVVSEGEFVGESIGCPSRDLKPDDYFGEAIFIHPSPMSSVSVTCTSPAGGSLWTIYTDALRQVLKDTSMKQYLLARGTLDRVPKLLRDSINAIQFVSICKSAELLQIPSGQPVVGPADSGLLIAISGSTSTNNPLTPGSLIFPSLQPPLITISPCQFLSISEWEIASIPPLTVALTSLRSNSVVVEGVLPSSTPPRISVDGASPTSVTGHPLSPSLRPSLAEIDVSKIHLFDLVSISAKTHLINRVQFLTIPYDGPNTLLPVDLGVLLMLNGTAVVTASDGVSVSLTDGHCVGMGEADSRFRGSVRVDSDKSFYDADDSGHTPSPVVIAYWPDRQVRAALPGIVREELEESKILLFLRGRKLLIRNPIFQFLKDAGVSAILTQSTTVLLNHNDLLSHTLQPGESFIVTEGSVAVTNDGDDLRVVSLGGVFNSESLIDTGVITTSNTPPVSRVVTCHSVKAEILIINQAVFRTAFQEVAGNPEAVERIHNYLKMLRERVELADVKIGKTIGRGGTAVVKLACVPKESEETLYALKIVKKKLLEKHNKLSLLKNEKSILQQLDASPFIIKLKSTFKDTRHLYFLLELAPGGDLLSVLNTLGLLTRSQAQFYLGCMVRALEYCHAHGIVYRDLKPENLLVDAAGYVKLSDFGVAKKLVKGVTYSLVGTPQFMAPEIILGKGYGVTVDLWALGCCLHEFLIGELPLQISDESQNYQFELFQKIVQFNPMTAIPTDAVDADSLDLIRRLLSPDPHRRIGCSVGTGIRELTEHAFFSSELGFSWDALDARTLIPPFVPQLSTAVLKRPMSSGGASDATSEVGTEEMPTASPALSSVSWTSFEHPAGPRDTDMSWDLNF